RRAAMAPGVLARRLAPHGHGWSGYAHSGCRACRRHQRAWDAVTGALSRVPLGGARIPAARDGLDAARDGPRPASRVTCANCLAVHPRWQRRRHAALPEIWLSEHYEVQPLPNDPTRTEERMRLRLF